METSEKAVMVVDDETGLVDLYEAWLTDSYEVITAYSGEEALDRLERNPDVIVLDRLMPGLSGDEFLRTIRERGYDCPVALASAVEPDGDVLELGFGDYLTKPVSREELNDTVEKLLRRASYQESIREYFDISQKLALIDETNLDDAWLETYRGLVERRDCLELELDGLLESFDEQDIQTVMGESRHEQD